MFEIVQNLEFDVLAEIAKLKSEVEPVVVLAPLPPEDREYIFGIIRKPAQMSAAGTRREREPYRFVNGKREPNRRSRFSQK